jgi:hypothetical protein
VELRPISFKGLRYPGLRPCEAGAMSPSASEAADFYREVAESGVVWAIRDEGGYPAPKGDEGRRAMPFWSSRARAERIIATVPAYSAFEPVALSWAEFATKWVPGLERDGLRVGVNWSGSRATGYDVEPSQVRGAIQALLSLRG